MDMVVDVMLAPRPLADDEVRIEEDLDTVAESAMCSCSSSDSNPY